MKMIVRFLSAALMMVTLYGCGGDGGSSAQVTNSYVFPAGKATLAFTAVSTARLAVPVSGIDFAVTLPEGMSATAVSGSSGQIETASVVPGGGLTGTNLAFGSYSASSRTARLSMVTTSDTFRGGEFLRLICTVAPNTSITYGALVAMNTPVAVAKVVGYDPVTRSTIILTNKMKVTIGVVP